MSVSRRNFLCSASAAALAFGGLQTWLAQAAAAQAYAIDPVRGIDKYGPLLGDRAGLLDLPHGFSYRVISREGDRMNDGFFTPGGFDGMAAFPVSGAPNLCALVRNHEILADDAERGPCGGEQALIAKLPAGRIYDHAPDGRPLGGGTTTLIYDFRMQRLERAFLSLTGTTVNCAGGPTPWGSWLSCEESDLSPGDRVDKPHGWVFEVPSAAPGLVEPVPLRAMGRFVHEAAAVDPATGIVYLTEDSHEGLLYRFLPARKGRLREGGRLQALALRGARGADLRNWPVQPGPIGGQGTIAQIGDEFDVDWIDVADVEAPDADLRLRGFAGGALRFARGEGMAFGRRPDGGSEIFFACTMGGPARIGQVWRYRPGAHEGTGREQEAPGRLDLFVESADPAVLEYCDNVAVAPWGDVLLCEDGRDEQYLRGVTPDGRLYTLARNAHRDRAEFCGACFSPDGKTLFVNVQDPGMTFAVTGPWTAA